MKITLMRFLAILVIGMGLLVPQTKAWADSQSFKELSAEWWQWVVSIPPSENPLLDKTGDKCVVGQRGSLWFLVGSMGKEATRTCTVPEGKTLFFPVINSLAYDSPNVCGQDANRFPVSDMIAYNAAFVDGATNLSVLVDGEPIEKFHRAVSVFEITVPNGNILDIPCLKYNYGAVPAGVYSPSVDVGYYVRLKPLEVGKHTIHIHAENNTDPKYPFLLDVNYALTVVPVNLGHD